MKIGEVARRAGIPASSLRYYEREKLLRAPHRVAGRREYDYSVLEEIGLIRLARDAGFTINETRALLHGFSAETPPSVRWHALAVRKLVEVEKVIKKSRSMRRFLKRALACECPRLADCAKMVNQ